MGQENLINDVRDAIIKIYSEYELTSLREYFTNKLSDQRDVLSHYFEVIRKCWVKYPTQFNYFENHDDLLFCSDTVMYFTAHLFLYRPYINNPVKDKYRFGNEFYSPNYQNLEAKRYDMYTDVVSQTLYNYWDRIGDLIASFFPGELKPTAIFFGSALEKIPKQFHGSDNFKWLNDFKNNEYKELNEIRKKTVHYVSSATQYKHQMLKIGTDDLQVKDLFNQRFSIPDLYKKHITLTLNGFEKTILLLGEMTEVLFADVP